MERAAASYGKINRVDVEDEQELPYDDIVPQPFCPTMDPEITLGLKPIPNLYERIKKLTAELARDVIDIDDVEFEEADLMEQHLYPTSDNEADKPQS